MALKKRIVVVGLGSIGQRHVRLLDGRGDVMVELCEPNAEILKAALSELGPHPAHRAYAAAIASKPDMVLIATPHGFHAEQTVQALAANIHVLCEKPMSDTLAGAEKMRAAAEKSQAILCIAFMLQFHPAMVRFKKMIDSGDLGKLIALQYHVGTYITLVNSRSRYQAVMEGALLMDYAHEPDIIYWLTGQKPAGVYARGGQAGDMEFSSNPNYLTMVCDYDSPLLTTIHLNYLQMPQHHECQVIGDKAWALWDMDKKRFRVGRTAERSDLEEPLPAEVDQLYRDEHQSFLDATEGRCKPFRSAKDGMVSMQVIEAALQSWKSGRRVAL